MDKSPDVIAEGEYHQQHQEDHTDDLGYFQELVAGLASGDHLVEAEHYVSAIKGGDGQEVHHAQHDGQKGEDVDEPEPVPGGRKDLADGYEAADGLVGLGLRGGQELEVAQIAANCAEGKVESCRDSFQH